MRRTKRRLGSLIAVVAGAALACTGDGSTPADDARLGAMLYQSHGCGACHGADGRGGGPLAARLGDRLPDLTRGELRHGSTVEEVAATIGRGAGAMPPFGHVPPADREILARWVLAMGDAASNPESTLDVEPRGVRATPPGADRTAAYLTIFNRGQDDELLAVSGPPGSRASLHRSTTAGGVMRMEAVGRLALPAGAAVELAPGGLHVMLEDLPAPLRQGESVTLRLRFLHHAPLTVELPVELEIAE
jgi:copper(I)-binding protein